MAVVRIPTPLRPLCGNQPQVEVSAPDVRGALAFIEARHPGFLAKVQDGEGRLHRFVNVFVNADDVRHGRGLETPVGESDTITIVPAIAGGR